MADVAQTIADYLAAQSVGTVGTDIFFDQVPVESSLPVDEAAVTVIESGGLDPEINADRKHFNPTVQIIVTGTQESKNQCRQVFTWLLLPRLPPRPFGDLHVSRHCPA